MAEFVVFYAWQSDRSPRLNRHLIRFALNLAAKNISSDPTVDVKVRIDADTEGVLGHVPVTDTILKKIADCDAFVPDLTFVAETADGKLIPNPNVMIEYGYALHAKSHSVMIPVMNTAYGPAEQLPFDMGHLRHPLKYELPVAATQAERRAVIRTLTSEFERILRLMLIAAPTHQSIPFKEAAPVGAPGLFFALNDKVANFGNPGEQEYRFELSGAIYLRLFPKYSDGQPKLKRINMKSLVVDRRAINAMSSTNGGLASPNYHGWISIDPSSDSTTKGITQVFPTGELWGVNSSVFSVVHMRRTIDAPIKVALVISMIEAERIYTRALEHYAAIATMLQFRPPYVIEIGAVGLMGVFMAAPHVEFASGYYYGPFRQSSLVQRSDLHDLQTGTLHNALRQFLEELYDLAETSRSDVLTDEIVSINQIPTRS